MYSNIYTIKAIPSFITVVLLLLLCPYTKEEVSVLLLPSSGWQRFGPSIIKWYYYMQCMLIQLSMQHTMITKSTTG